MFEGQLENYNPWNVGSRTTSLQIFLAGVDAFSGSRIATEESMEATENFSTETTLGTSTLNSRVRSQKATNRLHVNLAEATMVHYRKLE